MENKKVWIVGHKNPDTDSVCSAISYAYLKNAIDPDTTYEPKRAGDLNEETKYVLDTFKVKCPSLITDVGAQVKDIEIRRTAGVSEKISLKAAWEMMKEQNVVTLPITTASNHLEGVIITQDITTSYMDVYDNFVLSRAKTSYKNIIETLNGTMLTGNDHAYFNKGKVMIGSANPEIMEDFIEENDLVIMGNRYDSQICALEGNASCLIVTGDPKVSKSIVKLAEEKNCVLITTAYDTFTTARLINQSMPIKYFMRKENLITFDIEDYIDGVRETMSQVKHRDFPVLDEDGKYVGMISRRNLLNMKKKQIILVDHNEVTQAVDNINGADILEIIDHHRIGNLETVGPVVFRNQPLGCTATIIYQMYKENQVEIPKDIAGLLCSAILSDTLMFRSPTCTPLDKYVAEDLARIAGIDVEKHATSMFQAGSNFDSKTPEEIFYQDFKTFTQNGVNFGVAQVSAMTQVELDAVKEKLTPYLPEAMAERKIDMVFVMLTNIVEETSYVISAGENAESLIEHGYHVKPENGYQKVKGLVSRKKQLIPVLISAIQEQ